MNCDKFIRKQLCVIEVIYIQYRHYKFGGKYIQGALEKFCQVLYVVQSWYNMSTKVNKIIEFVGALYLLMFVRPTISFVELRFYGCF